MCSRSLRVPLRRRLPLAGGLAAGTVLLFSAPAFAHVTVDPGEAEQGGYSTVNFKVPNERDNASTVRLEVVLPKDHPLTAVMPQPVPGWDVKVTTKKLDTPVESHGKKITEAATRVVWTGGKISPGTFQQFPVSVGPLPKDTDRLVFKALQTYSSKETVRWIEVPEQGEAEPDNPAPVLRLSAPSDEPAGQRSPGGAGGSRADSGTGDSAASASGDSDTTARVLGVVGIVVGVLGVAFGVFAGRRRPA